ncbi:WYL domain-containing protein [Clostridium aestuarii]|uniref:WYL domain-containing protein n=1 Tax=Clostridium aestuarii TaxID=338193 RepID=A0ABT4D3K1_9CLOT|nr:WYL domain-containing protein [Clostridium aestuarii]MCY6485824.1 WYL domain-containing protein [Clostridium aestuarii]
MERLKSEALIYIYDKLNKGKTIYKEDVMNKYKISSRTFDRYISDIRSYFYNESKFKKIEYDRKKGEKGGYVLENQDKKCLNQKDILAITKVLLESRGFIDKEMNLVIDKLLMNCVAQDKTNIEAIINNELENYISPKHGGKLIDKLWELSDAIKQQWILEIYYHKIGKNGEVDENVSKRKLYPQAILFCEYYFYLIAFIEGKSYEYPAIYRVDRIEKYKILDSRFKIEYSKRFKDGEFKKLIQFMQTGELQKIRFKFTGYSIEAVLDRLPNAKIIEQREDGYIVETKMFGKGIKMWLLSQGDAVEVLNPDKFKEEIKEVIENMRKKYK